MLYETAWNAEAERAFLAVYEDAGQVAEHAEEVRAGREVLLNAGAHGWLTVRVERPWRVVITGAAGNPGGFSAVLDAIEAFYQTVCVETYREPLIKMLTVRGYKIDHVRLYK